LKSWMHHFSGFFMLDQSRFDSNSSNDDHDESRSNHRRDCHCVRKR